MTREQAQVYAKIPREDLEKIYKGYAKHYDTLCSFANGAEIETFSFVRNGWYSVEAPAFDFDFKYRVKPNDAAQSAERWKPQDGEKFFCVCGDGEVCFVDFDEGFENDKEYVSFGNCFRTREEAEAARERVRAALNGEQTVSKTETVESLDGHELSDAEKGVIRILRRCKVETMWNGPFVYLEGQKTLSTCNAGVLFKFELGSKASDFGDLADDVIGEAEERREKGEPSW